MSADKHPGPNHGSSKESTPQPLHCIIETDGSYLNLDSLSFH